MDFALKGKAVDRPALAYQFFGGARHVLQAIGKNMRTVYGDPNLMASAQITAAELFGHDSSMMPWGCLTIEAEAFGCRLDIHENYYPQVKSRPLEDSRNLELLPTIDPGSSGRMPLVLEALTRLRARADDDIYIVGMVVSPFLVAAELRTMTWLLTDFIGDPGYVEALMEKVTEGIRKYLEAMIQTGVCDAIMFENAGATGDLIGPHHLEQFITPYHRKLVSAARKQDSSVTLIEHNCANKPYIDEILSGDVDAISFALGDGGGLNPLETWDNCKNHRFDDPNKAGRQMACIGNVDHSQLVLNGTCEDVFGAARAVIERAQGGPFCLSTGCEIPFKAPIENIQALSKAAWAGF